MQGGEDDRQTVGHVANGRDAVAVLPIWEAGHVVPGHIARQHNLCVQDGNYFHVKVDV